MSVPAGVVTLAERYGGGVLPRERVAAIIREVRAAIAPFEARHAIRARIAGGRVQMLGTSGTVTTLAGVHLCLERYRRELVDGVWLSFADVSRLAARLAAMDLAQRAAHPCIGPQRADLVAAGCAVLEALCRTWPVGRLRVADRGLREGILYRLMAEDGHRPAIRPAVAAAGG